MLDKVLGMQVRWDEHFGGIFSASKVKGNSFPELTLAQSLKSQKVLVRCDETIKYTIRRRRQGEE